MFNILRFIYVHVGGHSISFKTVDISDWLLCNYDRGLADDREALKFKESSLF